MEITIQEIEHLAKLSKLALTEEEKTRLKSEMGQIIDFANKLSALDTNAADPTMFASSLYNVFRDDTVESSLPTDAILQNAPEAEMGCFVVPKTVE